MPWKVGAFLVGACLLQTSARLPSPWLTIPAVAAAVAILWVTRGRLAWLQLPACALAGWGWAAAMALWQQPPELPWPPDGRTLQARLEIVSVPVVREGRARFIARIRRLEDPDPRGEADGDWRVRLSWRDPPSLAAGQAWSVPVRLKPVQSYRNPGGWDYAGWLWRQGIRYRGYVAKGERRLLATGACCRLARLRQALGGRLREAVAPGPGRALLLALVLGDRSELDADMRRVLAATGTSHLVAISGLHVSLAAGLVGGLVVWGWRRTPLAARVPALLAGAVAGLAAATVYALLSGLGLPAQRALLMLAVAALLLWQRRHLGRAEAFALVLLAVLAIQPAAVGDAGFWLSFGAVAAILALLPQLRGRPAWLRWPLLQGGITLALYPLLLAFEMPAAPLGALVNLVAVPLFSLLLLPLALGSALLAWLLPTAKAVPVGAAALLERAWEGLDAAAGWAGTSGHPAVSPLLIGLLALGAWGGLLLPGRARMAALALLVLLHLPPAPRLAPGEFRLTVLDVGQGLSAVVQTRSHWLVYDTGPGYPGGFNLADVALIPWLRHQGARRVDLLVLSHGDKDHAGAAAPLLRDFPVDAVLAGEPDRVVVSAARCPADYVWRWDGVRFRFLQPRWSARRHGNNASCVLLVEGQGGRALLTGDAEAAVERVLARRLSALAPLELVVAGHHGSRTSSSPAFVRAVRARNVIYSAGYRNRYRFPRPEVDRRWAAIGARRWRTDGCGAIEAEFPREGPVRIRTQRSRAPHYWLPGDRPCELLPGGDGAALGADAGIQYDSPIRDG